MEEEYGFGMVDEGTGKPYNIRHRCFYFSKSVLSLVKSHKIDYLYLSIDDQLIRSATSIGANMEEGFAGSSSKDWQKFLLIALKSANETKYWLCLVSDSVEVEKEEVNELLNEANEISNIIGSIIVNAKRNSKKENKA
jgi:four helix bundle protein